MKDYKEKAVKALERFDEDDLRAIKSFVMTVMAAQRSIESAKASDLQGRVKSYNEFDPIRDQFENAVGGERALDAAKLFAMQAINEAREAGVTITRHKFDETE